jgi:hypothetical protein
MGQSEGSESLLKAIEEASGALGGLPVSQEAMRFEREADGLRATIESWRETPPRPVTRSAVAQRVHRLHSEATKYARHDAAPESVADQPTSEGQRKPGDATGNERRTMPAPFSMEVFAWDMTAPGSEQRPPSEAPAPGQSTEGEAFAIDVDLDDALVGLDGAAEHALGTLLEDSAPPVITRREIEDPGAYMMELYGAGEYEAAIDMADVVLTETPSNLLVRECRDRCRDALAKVYAERVGPLERIPVLVTLSALSNSLAVDPRAGLLLSFIDGTSNLETILDDCSVPRLDALRLLHELAQRGVIGFK